MKRIQASAPSLPKLLSLPQCMSNKTDPDPRLAPATPSSPTWGDNNIENHAEVWLLGKSEQGLSTMLSVEKTRKREGKIIMGDTTQKDAARKSDSTRLTEILVSY